MKIDQDLINACDRLVKSIDAAEQRKAEQRKAEATKKARIARLREKFYGPNAPFVTVVC